MSSTTFHKVLSETFINTGTKETIDIDNTIVNLKPSSSFKNDIIRFVAEMRSKYPVQFTIHCIGDLNAELESAATDGSIDDVKLCIPSIDAIPLKLFIYSSHRFIL